jgi:hypothetical protein
MKDGKKTGEGHKAMAKIEVNRAILSFIALIIILVSGIIASSARAQGLQGPLRGYYAVKPLRAMTEAQVSAAAAAGTTFPIWDYSIVSPVDDNTYNGMMVGRSPFYAGMRSTTIQIYLIPTKVTPPLSTYSELAFYSWFYRQSLWIGTGGSHSDNGSLTTIQPVC